MHKIEADFPMTVKIGTGGKTKTFQKGQENKFFDWLAESRDSIYMWRGCVDIIGLTNLCQMDIDIIVHMEGTNPEVKHFSPDPDFPWKENDPRKPTKPNVRDHPKMTVLNYKDQHFNLVVEKESMIAQSGTFSFQRKVAEESKTKATNKKTDLEIKI